MNESIRIEAMKGLTIGLDLADVRSDWAAVDEGGTVVARGRVRTTESQLRKLFGSLGPALIAMEVGTQSAWISRVLGSCGHTVLVANARRLALIHANKRKNNRIDAEFLARLARADRALLFPIHHRDEASQADLALLRSRDVLVRTRTKLINHVRGMSKTFGRGLPKWSAPSFAERSRKALQEGLPGSLGQALEPVLDQIRSITEKIKTMDRQIDALLQRYPAAQRLTQITGVGALTALAYVLTIEDPSRILRSRSAGAYFGLVPGSGDSGETHEPKRITKEGDGFCRRLLVNAAHYILGPFGARVDSDLRRHGLAIGERGGKNARKRAVVAVARKLAVLMHHLWTSEQDYVPLFNASRQSTAA